MPKLLSAVLVAAQRAAFLLLLASWLSVLFFGAIEFLFALLWLGDSLFALFATGCAMPALTLLGAHLLTRASRGESALHFIVFLGAQLSALLFFGTMIAYAIDTLQSGAFSRAAFLVDYWLFSIDNFIKVVFFDFFEVFEVSMSGVDPETTLARIFTATLRLVLSVVLVSRLIAVSDLAAYPPASWRGERLFRRILLAMLASSLAVYNVVVWAI